MARRPSYCLPFTLKMGYWLKIGSVPHSSAQPSNPPTIFQPLIDRPVTATQRRPDSAQALMALFMLTCLSSSAPVSYPEHGLKNSRPPPFEVKPERCPLTEPLEDIFLLLGVVLGMQSTPLYTWVDGPQKSQTRRKERKRTI